MNRILVMAGIARRDRVQVRPRVVIERAKLPYLEERGWVREGNRYQGHYTTPQGSRWGEAHLEDGHLQFFIYDPPQAILDGPHGACFGHVGSNWYSVHFRKESPNPSDGIMAIGSVLEEAFRG